jgi:hypothetical protein
MKFFEYENTQFQLPDLKLFFLNLKMATIFVSLDLKSRDVKPPGIQEYT